MSNVYGVEVDRIQSIHIDLSPDADQYIDEDTLYNLTMQLYNSIKTKDYHNSQLTRIYTELLNTPITTYYYNCNGMGIYGIIEKLVYIAEKQESNTKTQLLNISNAIIDKFDETLTNMLLETKTFTHSDLTENHNYKLHQMCLLFGCIKRDMYRTIT